MISNGMRPIHPGEILREEYLEPLQMSVNALVHFTPSKCTGPSRSRVVLQILAERVAYKVVQRDALAAGSDARRQV